MNKEKIINELKIKYPGKRIILNNENNPTEIICEINPSSEHSENSIAIAVIDNTEAHYHKQSIELYEVLKGSLFLVVDGKKHKLKKGESFTIKSSEIHSAKGQETWIKVTSRPGWALEDHLPAKKLIDSLVLKIWNYHLMHQKLEKADAIFVLGSSDKRVAKRGTELFLKNWAPLLIFSGGSGRITRKDWNKSEAEVFADIALKMGVSREKMLLETRSTNTGENITFTKKLLKEKGLDLNKFILVQKPYMERRAWATFKKQWPEKEVIVTSPNISYKNYPYGEKTKEEMIHILVADLQRIKIYSEKGFQIYQEIPDDVWQAYEKLVKLGYTKHLIKEL